MEFLFIRNKLLQMWLADPLAELTAEKAQNTVLLPQSGERAGLSPVRGRGSVPDLRLGRGRGIQCLAVREVVTVTWCVCVH